MTMPDGPLVQWLLSIFSPFEVLLILLVICLIVGFGIAAIVVYWLERFEKWWKSRKPKPPESEADRLARKASRTY